jgi:hypothetical protein
MRKFLILLLLIPFALFGQKTYNYDLTVKSGKTIIKTGPTPLYYEKDGLKVSTAAILAKELDPKNFDPKIIKTPAEKADSVTAKVIQSNYIPKLEAEITLDASVTNVTVKGRNKAIENAEKLAGVQYPMYFAWVDGASTTKGIMKFKDDGNINKVYVVKGTYENPVITFISEHKIALGTRPYYTRKDGFITVYMDGFSGSGTSGDPYQITSWAELDDMRNHINSYYILMNNLSSATTGYDTYASSSANSGAGWIPLWTGSSTDFNGQGYTISDLYINSNASRYGTGLWGGIDGVIKNIGVINVNITSNDSYGSNQFGVGALGGYSGSALVLSNCYSTGSVTSTYQLYGRAGGLIGGLFNAATITNCYSTCTVVGHYQAGGFIGYIQALGINNCYSTGSVTSTHTSGGFTGFCNSPTNNTVNCFWDTQTSGKATSGGGETGKTTAEMKTLSTFTDASWSIANKSSWTNEAWYIDAGVDYPRLGWEMPASSNIKNIDGVLKANVKLFNGVTNANLKSFNGVQ